ncbi:Gfo/Idh/MocA family protein [Streptomyces litchfieldiae]|uniref:Gfo/Idh/MocA family oxidoreductase n=1 Tax=Streptomyces litchfieldiae TaxID=3075543 RepID=A0ABU2MUG7_9ACTN|nr:Gfo/Idh/MocA family oxidoreductase [Streptomyces sp. DSM 44938]MDT0344483.1 Gfo/Idh/MocA family oxidoreductase [Streptomyces sp. DSM 44938]
MRVGVIGLSRGLHLAGWCRRLGMEVVAACDRDAARREASRKELPGAVVTGRWEDLLEHRLDGVVLANDFDEHAPLAIAFLERGVHVLSECAACVDEDEGRRLVEAAERSTATYSFAENFVHHPHVRLVRQVAEGGELGRVGLIEADYLHGMSPEVITALIGDPGSWRGRIAATAYCTHTVSPVLAVTGAWPVEVAAFPADEASPRDAVVMTVRLSTGALAVTRHGFLQGEPDSHWSWLSVRGSRALAESVRAPGERSWSVRVRAESWTRADGVAHEEERTPPPLTLNGQRVERQDEGTVRVLQGFEATVERGEPPLVPVRPAVAASLVGVAGAESLRNGSRPVRVPDFSPK